MFPGSVNVSKSSLNMIIPSPWHPPTPKLNNLVSLQLVKMRLGTGARKGAAGGMFLMWLSCPGHSGPLVWPYLLPSQSDQHSFYALSFCRPSGWASRCSTDLVRRASVFLLQFNFLTIRLDEVKTRKHWDLKLGIKCRSGFHQAMLPPCHLTNETIPSQGQFVIAQSN